MEKVVDVRGLECPLPVVRAKEALAEVEGGTLVVLVDDAISRDNVRRAAEKWGHGVAIAEQGGAIAVRIEKRAPQAPQVELPQQRLTVAFISSDQVGRGEEPLGRLLMRSFLFALTQGSAPPNRMIFMNRGIHLAVNGSEVLDSLKALAAAGCEILVCGTCLDYFGLKDQVAVGRVSNMYEIVETLTEADRIIAP
jgi:selenium metabolism protein YedF